MKHLLVPTVVILALSGVVVHEGRLRGRLDELAERPQADPRLVGELRQQVSELNEALDQTRARLLDERSQRDAEIREVEELEWRLASLEATLGETDAEIERYSSRLNDWESQWSGHEPNLFDQRLQDLRGCLEERWVELDALAASAARVAEEDRLRIEELDQSLVSLTDRDIHGMWKDLVGPVVQIAGDATVGSGVLLESIPIHGDSPEPIAWRTNLLTSWHVVRDIYASPAEITEPIAIKLYQKDGGTFYERAILRAHDVELDVALLELETTEPVPHGARLPSRERLTEVQVFDSVYAVGCPLGNDPIPTAGEIASTNHLVDGESYWMISAPTYIGNSGGGIFDARTHELLGIFSKIYTHGSLRSTIVPHMGLVTPMPIIYDWFDQAGYGEVAQGAGEQDPAEPQEAAVSTAHR